MLKPFTAWPLNHPRCLYNTTIKIYIIHIPQMKDNSCVQTKLLNHNIAHTLEHSMQNDMIPLLITHSINIINNMVSSVSTQLLPKPKNNSTGMPMGNGEAHGSKSQTIV